MKALYDILSNMRKPCKGCGKPVIFLQEMDTGKWQILDPAAPTYDVEGTGDDRVVCIRSTAMVSHFKTCPKASQF